MANCIYCLYDTTLNLPRLSLIYSIRGLRIYVYRCIRCIWRTYVADLCNMTYEASSTELRNRIAADLQTRQMRSLNRIFTKAGASVGQSASGSAVTLSLKNTYGEQLAPPAPQHMPSVRTVQRHVTFARHVTQRQGHVTQLLPTS